MALLLLNACVQFDVGHTKCFVKNMRLNLLPWLLRKICKRMLVRFFLSDFILLKIWFQIRFRIHSICRSLCQCSRWPIAYELFELRYYSWFGKEIFCSRFVWARIRRHFFSIWIAVWAGWGHASENPKLPELLHQNGIIFIGNEFRIDCYRNDFVVFRSTWTSHVGIRR